MLINFFAFSGTSGKAPKPNSRGQAPMGSSSVDHSSIAQAEKIIYFGPPHSIRLWSENSIMLCKETNCMSSRGKKAATQVPTNSVVKTLICL